MDLKHLTDDELITETTSMVKAELSATAQVIRHFQEIYDRELYLKCGYANMFLMVTKNFGLCNGSAQLRINAMKLIRDVPAAKEKIERGELSLTVAANVQTFLRAEKKQQRPYSETAKIELIETCTGKSVIEAEKEFVRRNPEIEKRESVRYTSETTLRVSHSLSVKTEEKLKRIKEIWSHVNPNMTRDELIDRMAEITLDQIDPLRKAERAEARRTKRVQTQEAKHAEAQETKGIEAQEAKLPEADKARSAKAKEVNSKETDTAEPVTNRAPSKPAPTNPLHAHEVNRTRYISAKDRAHVVLKNSDQGCEFINEKSGQRCGSKHLLQNDHVIPWSQGGSNEAGNLRLYCANHNRWSWRNRPGSRVRCVQEAYR